MKNKISMTCNASKFMYNVPCSLKRRLNPLAKDKNFYCFKFKAFADNKINVKNIEKCLCEGRKHCGKRRKCWLPAFSPFPTMFSKVLLIEGCYKLGLCGKELTLHQKAKFQTGPN